MKSRLFLWSLVSALAGFLFGFDTVVISGAEKTIQALWGLNPKMHGLAIGAALWGTVLGSLVGSWPTDKFGRKNTLLSIGLLFLVGSLWSALANEVYSFMIARFLGGIAIGISTVAAPLYISEISPPERRGRLAGMFQFNIVFGILVALISNYLLSGIGVNAWRWMLGIMAVPSVVYTFACFLIPESPRWLIGRKGDRVAGTRVLQLIYPNVSAAAIELRADEIAAVSHEATSTGPFLSKRLRVPILLAFLIAFFNQLSGINAILYFAPRIFGLTGSEDGLAQSIGIGVTNLIFTFVGLWLIDRLGRRTLLFIGSFGYIASLGMCAAAFFIWASPFRAASLAIDVKEAVKAVRAANESGQEAPIEQLAKKQKDLEEASRAEGSGTEPVNFKGGAALDEIEATASVVLKQASVGSGQGGRLVAFCIFAFIAAHAVGQGAVIWVFISEIFPNRHRAQGQSLGSFTHWIFCALLTTVFPMMVTALAPGVIFLFFCAMMVLQLVWVKTMVPETKGRTLEQIERDLGMR